jgi:hypothetical protein
MLKYHHSWVFNLGTYFTKMDFLDSPKVGVHFSGAV